MECCWWVVLMGCVAVMCYWFLLRLEMMRSPRGKVPRGTNGWPFIGETLEFIASGYSSKPVSFMDKRKSLYGKVFKTNILGTPIIVSTDPELNKVVLQNHGNIFVPAYPKTIQELFGENSILKMNGSNQKKLHALIGGYLRSPQFKSQIVRDIENSVKQTLKSWGEKGRLILFQEEIKQITFPVLVKVLMSLGPGDKLKFMRKEFNEFIKGLICLPIKFPGTTLYKSLKAKQRLLKVVEKIVEEREASIDKLDGHVRINDTLDVLLHEKDETSENRRFSSDFICGNLIEMVIPGEETVPTAMTAAVKFLSDSPEVLKQLREENMELKRQKTESLEEYSWTDYMSLPFTQNVISETLRLANIINAVWRKATKDVEIKGYLIPQGWCVLTSFTAVHMDEEKYENPYEFNPWRWEKTGAAVNNSNFTPFGGGQRLCPGLELSRLEIAVFLHHFITAYSWEAEEDSIVYFPTVKMKRKLPIKVTPLFSA